MKSNIETKGRIMRALIALLFLALALFGLFKNWSFWICIPLVFGGLLMCFQAVQGWCLARACGIKTRF